VTAVVLAGCGGGRSAALTAVPAAAHTGGSASVRVVSNVDLRAGAGAASAGWRSPLPAPSPLVSFDVTLTPGSRLSVGAGAGPGAGNGPAGDGAGTGGSAGSSFVLRRGGGTAVSLVALGGSFALTVPSGWLRRAWHVEWAGDRLAVDGRSYAVAAAQGPELKLRASQGHADVTALITSSAADRGALLLHRLAELHARIPPRQFPIGAEVSDRIHYGSTYWTSGFWPGALWQAAKLAPAYELFLRWALTATIQHVGQEHSGTHDVGFEYGESSLAAWQALCRAGWSGASPQLCARLKRSVLAAADQLLELAASNPGSGTIPTNATTGDTIIDSMMNIAILPWASQVTGNPAYRRLASHHAHVVASLLVRRNGSTAQSVNFDRATGKVLLISTHQGLSSSSTWSRGQGWAVYGFSQAASDLHDRGLLRVALRTARYVAAHLPAGGIPRWDYDAPAGAPVDVSAGVITAAGLFHLAAACQVLPGVCVEPDQWVALGRRMLAAALTRADDRPPLGFLGSEVLNERGRGCWCDGGELSFGLTYALEAINLERQAAG
jgi:unsaturated chondroitin disaccharide hydrolase